MQKWGHIEKTTRVWMCNVNSVRFFYYFALLLHRLLLSYVRRYSVVVWYSFCVPHFKWIFYINVFRIQVAWGVEERQWERTAEKKQAMHSHIVSWQNLEKKVWYSRCSYVIEMSDERRWAEKKAQSKNKHSLGMGHRNGERKKKKPYMTASKLRTIYV